MHLASFLVWSDFVAGLSVLLFFPRSICLNNEHVLRLYFEAFQLEDVERIILFFTVVSHSTGIIRRRFALYAVLFAYHADLVRKITYIASNSYRDIYNENFTRYFQQRHTVYNTEVISSVPTRPNAVFAVLQFLWIYVYRQLYL